MLSTLWPTALAIFTFGLLPEIFYGLIECANTFTKKPIYVCVAEGWVNNGDTCYHVLGTRVKWAHVEKICATLKAQFAYVDDRNDMDALARAAALRSAPTVWLKGSNTQARKSGKFVWHDVALTEIDGKTTHWAAGYPEQKTSVDQFVYMKVDLEAKKSYGMAHSVGTIDRHVACMMQAKDLVHTEVGHPFDKKLLHTRAEQKTHRHKKFQSDNVESSHRVQHWRRGNENVKFQRRNDVQFIDAKGGKPKHFRRIDREENGTTITRNSVNRMLCLKLPLVSVVVIFTYAGALLLV